MYRRDIERIVAQAQRIQNIGFDLLSDAEAISSEGVDTSTSTNLGNSQSELQDEMEQLLLDIETGLEKSDGIGGSPDYKPDLSSFGITWDEGTETATITYSGDPQLSNSDITVTVAGSVQNNLFSDPTETGDSVTVDTSGLVDADEIVVEWIATDTQSQRIQLPNSSRAPVSKTNLPPESNITSSSVVHSTQFTITR